MPNLAEQYRDFRKPYLAGRPVRKVVTKRRKRATGLVSSVKNNGSIPWESQIERDKIYLLETAADVEAYEAQPEEFHYQLDGEMRRYYPDFRVTYWDGRREIVEVKCQADADDEENRRAFEAIRKAYAEKNIEFRVVTDTEIRKQPRLDNAIELLKFRDYQPNSRLASKVRHLFALQPPKTLQELADTLQFASWGEPKLLGMAARGHFGIELDAIPLCPKSPVFPTNPLGAR
ncbi:MAG TPA: Tn7 transposase TnsA N-terminal domain-containing protein [Ferrovibrio sp.]|uniref:Tn7 transposase TnsA N-terminal domain-containing protein n=1 Tax=Ferrovibrio sp. TaxID=1917215 RepID=UPI002ED1186D